MNTVRPRTIIINKKQFEMPCEQPNKGEAKSEKNIIVKI